jgi:hypothetical protein
MYSYCLIHHGNELGIHLIKAHVFHKYMAPCARMIMVVDNMT